jgi:signal transduction histidine kinase
MSNWFFSLQFRLILGFATVLALTLGSVGAYIGFSANREEEKINQLQDQARRLRTEQTLSDYYAAVGGWERLPTVIERMGLITGHRITVFNDGGVVVGDSFGRKDPEYLELAESLRTTPIRDKDKTVGYVIFEPINVVVDAASKRADLLSEAGWLSRREANYRLNLMESARPPARLLSRLENPPPPTLFADATNRSLLWAGLVAGVGGIMAISLLHKRALRSVRTLNEAARSLGRGDLSQRVPDPGRDEIGNLSRTFNSMAEGLENAENQRRNLVADIAHELRTPLTNVQGYIEAVRDGVLEPDNATIETIHQQILYLARLMDDLKLLAETEADDFYLNIEENSMTEVVKRSVEAFRPSADLKNVAITAVMSPGLPLINMDRTRIAQVLNNLLSNAIRHTPRGGEVTVSGETVKQSSIRITVSDSGEGISSEDLPFIFNRFHRADPSRTRSTGGVGLGLTIAKQLVEAHGGTISVTSVTGQGTDFVIDVPMDGPS